VALANLTGTHYQRFLQCLLALTVVKRLTVNLLKYREPTKQGNTAQWYVLHQHSPPNVTLRVCFQWMFKEIAIERIVDLKD